MGDRARSALSRPRGRSGPANSGPSRADRRVAVLYAVAALLSFVGIAATPERALAQVDGSAIVSTALEHTGARYRWGGASPAGFDCSGLIYYVLQENGIPVPRDHAGQLSAGARIDRQELEPGDLVFFRNTYTWGLSHSGIYVGSDQFIHAGTEWTGVVVSSLSDPYWASRWFGATRVR